MVVPFLILLAGQGVPRPEPSHKDWGPSPPVAPYGETALPQDTVIVPIVFPVLGKSRWDNGYGEERGGFKHTGIDIRAPKMTPIVAPFAGVIGLKRESFWIYGDNGYAMLGTHLNDDTLGKSDHRGDRDVMFAPGLRPGQHVVQGQFIGYVGMSGDATAPHLHFEIYAPGRGKIQSRIRNPFPSLQRATILTRPVPMPGNPQDAPGSGDEKITGCIRKVDPESMSVTLLLLQRQSGATAPVVTTYPTWRKVRINAAQLQELGGWTVLNSYGDTHLFTIHTKATKESIAVATKIGLPPGVKISTK